MTENSAKSVDGFIQEHIDSVPQLEALMLLWNSRPRGWSCDEIAARLYLPADKVEGLLQDLMRSWLVNASGDPTPLYAYFARSAEQDEMVGLVYEAYRHDLVRISTMIHAKASSAIREFARAFRIKKDENR